MVVLPAPASGKQILPYLPPDMLYAMCRYELTGGPVSVTAAVSGPGWVLSLHTPQGDNFYVMPGQQLRRGEVSFLLVPSGSDEPPTPAARQPDRHPGCLAAGRRPDRRARAARRAWPGWRRPKPTLRRSSCTQVKR